MDLYEILKNVIKNKLEIISWGCALNRNVKETFEQCYHFCFDSAECQNVDSFLLRIDTVIDYLHDELNMGHWSEVPLDARKAFTGASFLKALVILRSENGATPENIEKALKSVDLGLLLGAPLHDNSELLTQTAVLLTSKLVANPIERTSKRKTVDVKCTDSFKKLSGTEVKCLQCPIIEQFNKAYYLPQIPVKLVECISHWPASKKWLDLNYLLKVAGSRTVPIEIGSHYTDENWTQKLMSLRDFIKDHYLGEAKSIGYLAQHNLFDQISELRDDIRIPDYCALSRNYDDSSEPDINAWFGPEGTVSPLHYDPKDNLLAQVYGTKQILLYSPMDSDKLYPHKDKLLFNTAQVDPYAPEIEKFPKFSSTTAYKCLLKPGEMLYIPLKWWHHVTALDKSFSVSFWWK
ncbi:hypothetical protein FQA39_LY17581 [Lamprigera yunnana]|nr:hypothetical protein FQA39_LY17581 [Lamprigera yunnana]